MNIKIEISNASDYMKNTSMVSWKKYFSKYSLSLIIVLIAGVMGIAIGTLNFGPEPALINNFHYTNWNFGAFLGFTCIFLDLYLLYMLFKGKAKFIKKVKVAADRVATGTNKIIIEMDEHHFLYQNDDSRIELKWALFVHFTLYMEHILLCVDEHTYAYYVIDKKLLSSDEFSQLHEFLKNKIPYLP